VVEAVAAVEVEVDGRCGLEVFVVADRTVEVIARRTWSRRIAAECRWHIDAGYVVDAVVPGFCSFG